MSLIVIVLFLLVASIAFILIVIILIRPALEKMVDRAVDRAMDTNKLAVYDELIKQIDAIIEETKQDEELRQTEQERLEQLQQQKAQLEALLQSDPDNKKIKTAIERINKILS